ncbi:MAG: hypothetical protein P1U56_13355, partial [Saprospiraceae bacterium]|nr:hypothetical protein [Saprospiraceae bacterium]
MKNIIYLSTLLFLVGLISCQTCPKCPPPADDMVTLPPEDAIPLAQFQEWVHNWDSLGQTYTANTLTQYFTMPLVDMTEFVDHIDTTATDTVAAARFYLGLDIRNNTMTPHVMLVGVNTEGDSLTDASMGQYIYDVTKPCPSMCNKASLP